MRNNKVIDPSLNKKIVENEKRMQNLFNSEFSKSKSKNNIKKPSNSQTNMRNVHHKKHKSQDEIYNTAYKTIDNRDINRLKGAFNVTISKTIEKGDDNDSSAFTNRMAKRMNQKKQAEEEKNNKTFHDTINNIYQKFQERKNKNKKVYNKGQVDNIVDRLYTNDYKTKKKLNNESQTNRYRKDFERENNTIDFSIRAGSNGNIIKRQNEPSNVNVDELIERFEEDMKKRSENMERKRREIKRNEKKIYTYKPKINETNRISQSAGKDDFFARQKRYEEKKKKKEEKFKENLKNEEEKKIKENNFLLQKNNRKEKKGKKGKKDENEKNGKNKSDNIRKKEEIDKRIKYMYDWENKRKEKIENKMKEKTGKAETEFDHMPKIDERSSSMANKSKRRREEPDVFSRLAKEDKMLKEKRQVLIDLYKPTFQPNTFLHNQKIRKNNQYDGQKEPTKKEYPKSESSSDSDSDDDDDDDDDDGKDNDEESSSSDSDEKEDDFDYKQDPKKFAEDNVQDALRKALFNKKKK